MLIKCGSCLVAAYIIWKSELKHVGVLTKYFNIYVCASVGMNNKQYKMHIIYIKILEAQQSRMCNIYKNMKLKLLKTNASMWYNKICKAKQLTLKYIHIKINGNNTQSKMTITAATKYRFNQEIKFLYRKKQNQNEQLYRTYLECTNNWNGVWHYTQTTTNSQLDKVIDTLYEKLNKKLDALQGHKPVNHN
jgi:hypothetical protein